MGLSLDRLKTPAPGAPLSVVRHVRATAPERQRTVVALDTETTLISAAEPVPRLICASTAHMGENTVVTQLLGNAEGDMLEATLRRLLEDDEILLVGHNIAFDMRVIARAFPELAPLIWAAYQADRIADTKVREKLLNLSDRGRMDEITAPDGSTKKITYKLADLAATYLGVDRYEAKAGADAWRLNYASLDGVSVASYPAEAVKYACDDAGDTLSVYFRQAERCRVRGLSLVTETFQARADYGLSAFSKAGIATDPEHVARIKAALDHELSAERLNLLVENGFLTPAQPSLPYANGAKNPDGTPKMKKPSKEKFAKKKFGEHVLGVWESLGKDPVYTEKGGICTDKKVLKRLAPHCEIIAQARHRQSYQKLVTDFMKRVCDIDPETNEITAVHPFVYPEYDVLKETSRTSSYAGTLYPSCNIQQIPGEIGGLDPRMCFVPRPGRVFLGADYSSLELVGVAQTNLWLFGHSEHARLLAKGVDLHAYLGAQIAYRKWPEFREACLREGISHKDAIYRAFFRLKTHENEAIRKEFKHFRTLAKPVGLGFPGGMGPATLVEGPAEQYGVKMTVDEAREIRDEVWFPTFPEMRAYFRWVNQQVDPRNKSIGRDDEGKPITGHRYVTPLGMVRSGATYCATANGFAMQSPGAEGAKHAVIEVARIADLEGYWTPIAFIHDEIIVEVDDRQDVIDEAAARLSDIMQREMLKVLPDVPIEAEPLAMRVWSKEADPIVKDGHLIPWEPKTLQEAA